jgi:hypothetical protein
MDSLRGTPPAIVELVADALRLTSGPIGRFALPLSYCATWLEYPDVDGWLARIVLARVLRLVAYDPGYSDMVARLARADAPPWPAIHAALVDLHPHLVEAPEITEDDDEPSQTDETEGI